MSLGDWPDPPGQDQEAYEAWLDQRTSPFSDPDYILWRMAVYGRRLMWAAAVRPIQVVGYWECTWRNQRRVAFYTINESGDRFIGRRPVAWTNQRSSLVAIRPGWVHGCLIIDRRTRVLEMATCRSGQIPCDEEGSVLYGLAITELSESDKEIINASLFGRDKEGAARSREIGARETGFGISASTPRSIDG